MGRQAKTFSQLLLDGLAKVETLSEVERATGIKRQSLATFLRGESTLRLDAADVLAEYLGIESRVTKQTKQATKRNQ